MPPNILLVVLDAARRDALEPYDPTADTPAIADLARRGHAVPHAYATSSWTLPSHTSMFTGLLPRAARLGQPPDGTLASVKPALSGLRDRFLPVVLARAGYACHGLSANVWVSEGGGFDMGFDSFRFVASGRTERINALTGGGVRGTLAWALEGARSVADDGAAEIGSALRSQIAGHDGTPTFWFVNLVECHSPYLPPRPWSDVGVADRMRAAFDSQRYLSFESICRHVAGDQEIPAESLERMRHLYGRSVSYMDDWLSGVFEALEARGILDETLVIVCSDHGEGFDENGLIAHGFGLDESLINVPFVAAGPGASTFDRDSLSLVSLPSLLAQAVDVSGARSWEVWDEPFVAQYDPLAAIDDPKIVAFASKFGIGPAGIARLCAGFTCAVDPRSSSKLVVDDRGLETRYALPDDAPLGFATRDEPRFTRLRLATSGSQGDSKLVESPGPSAEASPDELAALEAQMKLLGYM